MFVKLLLILSINICAYSNPDAETTSKGNNNQLLNFLTIPGLKEQMFASTQSRNWDIIAKIIIRRVNKTMEKFKRLKKYFDLPLGAAYEGYNDVVLMLLANGLPINKVDVQTGRTMLHYAAQEGHYDLVKLLISLGADVNARDRRGFTPLHTSVHSGNLKIMNLLKENGADINVTGYNGWTPLHFAAYLEHSPATQWLINNGCDKTLRDINGNTALDVARLKTDALIEDIING